MNPVMYIILNKGAEMSTGKAAAQAAHAAVEAYKLSCKWHGGWFEEKSIANRWNMGGHYTKIVLEEPNAESLGLARAYIEARGLRSLRSLTKDVLSSTASSRGLLSE